MVTTTEPRWTEQDRAEALAWSLHLEQQCPGGCGHPLSETTSHYETGPQYDARKTTCRACAAREEAKRAAAKPGADDDGRLWYVNRIGG